jgi:thioesterase domain-containing protein
MHISELDELEASVSDLLTMAKVELEQNRLQQQRDRQIQEAVAQIEARLKPLLAKVEQMLQEYIREGGHQDSETKQRLEKKAADIRQEIAEAPTLAAQLADRQLILSEERLLDERITEQTAQWRLELKADLLEMIEEQRDFFSATDASIAVRGYANDLKAIGVLEEVVEALINQINSHSEEGPVARLRGSHEQTLTFIYNKALENRSRVDRAPDVQPIARHRKS